MNIHEYQAKQVLKAYGVPVAKGLPAFTVDEAVTAAQELGVGLSVLKRICRQIGLARWPFRTRQSLRGVIAKTQQYLVGADPREDSRSSGSQPQKALH